MIGEDGRMNARPRASLSRAGAAEASEAVVAALREEGRIRSEEPYTHSVPFSHRSGERIEPLISLQWFCRMDELAKPAIEVVQRRRGADPPEQWKRVYLDWMAEIRPWCISRQLWWGHRLPVWYCDACERDVRRRDRARALCEMRRRAAAGGGRARHLVQLGAVAVRDARLAGGRRPELQAFYPTDFLTTAREIIFLWVARMMMMGLEFAGRVPFNDVYVHSVIQAPDGRRMSKSLGPGIDPLDEIDEHGADALRFGLLAMSSTQDVRYSEAKVAAGPRPREQAVERVAAGPAERRRGRAGSRSRRVLEDRWILSRLQRAIEGVDGEARRLRLRPRRARPLPVHLVGVLRLVPGDRQAAPLRRRRGRLGNAAARARDACWRWRTR